MKTITINFPSLTAKQIYEKSKNEVDGGKLFYDIDWYKNEDFFTKEKTRKGKREIVLELQHAGKSWNECDTLKGDYEMLNFAEVIYLLWKHKEIRKLLNGNNEICYTWTSSRSSDGLLVSPCYFGSGGVDSGGWRPDSYHGDLGVLLSKSIGTLKVDALDLEKRVELLETRFKKLEEVFKD